MPLQNNTANNAQQNNSSSAITSSITKNNNLMPSTQTITLSDISKTLKLIPKYNLNANIVTSITDQCDKNINFFPNFNAINSPIPQNAVHTSFIDSVEMQLKTEEKARQVNQIMNNKLTKLLKSTTFTEAYKYWQLQRVIKELLELNIAPTIIFTRIMALSPNLAILLRDKRSPMRVAIDNKEIEVIASMLIEKSDRSDEKIFYLGKQLTELQYAMMTGNETVVLSLLDLAKTVGFVNLGKFPNNILKKTRKNKKKIESESLGERELKEYYHFDLDEETEKNIICLLKDLIKTLPKAKKTVHGFLTDDEYPLFRYLIDNKEKPKAVDFLILKIKKQGFIEKLIAEKNHQSPLPMMLNEQNLNETLKKACQLYESESYWNEKKTFHNELMFSNSGLGALYIDKHATSSYDKIMSTSRQLESFGHLVKKNILEAKRFHAHDIYNIFFSHSSPYTPITPYRSKIATHIIVLDVMQALRNGLLNERKMYVGSHMSPYLCDGSNPRILVMGENPDYKAIWSVYHCNHSDSLQLKKVYRIDYYSKGKLIESKVEEKFLKQEFFRGDNVKISGWKFALQARKFIGPFPDQHYYEYLITSFNRNKNTKAIEAARAIFFNVFNEESKLLQPLSLENEAIKVIENPILKNQIISEDDQKEIIRAILEHDHKAFDEFLSRPNIHKEMLEKSTLATVQALNIEALTKLLDFGVDITIENNLILRETFKIIKSKYFRLKSGEDLVSFNKAKEILSLLLFYGRADENDPDHIRYVSDVDSCGLADKNNLQTNRYNDLTTLIEVLVMVEDDYIRESIINSASKLLAPILFYAEMHVYDSIIKLINGRLKKEIAHNGNLLEECVKSRNIESLRLLLTIGDQVNHTQCFEVLSYAIQYGYKDLVHDFYLLCKKFNEFDQYFPVHRAIEFGQLLIVKQLLDLGEVDRKNYCNENLFATAVRCNNIAIIDLLLMHNIDFCDKLCLIVYYRQFDLLVKLITDSRSTIDINTVIRGINKETLLPFGNAIINNYAEESKRKNQFKVSLLLNLYKSFIKELFSLADISLREDLLKKLKCNDDSMSLCNAFNEMDLMIIEDSVRARLIKNPSTEKEEQSSSNDVLGKRKLVTFDNTAQVTQVNQPINLPFWKKTKKDDTKVQLSDAQIKNGLS